MRFFSKASEYAIRAMMQVVERDASKAFSPKDVCKEAGIPEAFARKTLQELARVRILKGTRGPGGGYQVIRPLSEISLLDIVLAVDGDYAFKHCPLGLACAVQAQGGGLRACEECTLTDPNCGLSHICPMHGLWKETRNLVVNYLQKTSLQDVADRLKDSHATAQAPGTVSAVELATGAGESAV